MRIATVFIAFLLLAGTAYSQTPNISSFGWLAGCWERGDKAKNLLISEQWMSPAGTSILGMGRTVKDGKTVDFEFVRIEIADKDVFYIAKPKANTAETGFKLIASDERSATFENLEHDFPQRIIYRLEGTEKLFARIEGTTKGKLKGIDFPMTRVKCS
jgi:hypothetical protein